MGNNKSNRKTSQKGSGNRKKKKGIPPAGDNIRIIPLGGVEEVGRNMTAIEFRDQIIIVDAGFQFQDEETPGIDYILPNIEYLEERKEMIKGIFITHGHLDHIGGIPYLIEKLGYPRIYTRRFGEMMIRKRQEEFKDLKPLDIYTVEGNSETITLSKDLSVQTFGISHAIPDSMGIIVQTPHGKVVVIKDVRVGHTDGVPLQEEIDQYAHFKDMDDVLLFTLDSTSVHKPGFSTPEHVVITNLEKYIKEAEGRLIIGTFASQVERIVEIIELSQKYNKKVVVEGRSMKSNVEIIKELGLLDVEENIIHISQADEEPDDRIVMLATGAQGEQYAALSRIANKTHKYIRLKPTDTVLLSSSIIPGNEHPITKLKDNLYRSEAKIVTYFDADVHASGHGNRGELEWIHTQIPYKFFMPLHGYHYMLRIHGELAEELGTPPENIGIPDNGSIFEIQDGGKKFVRTEYEAPSDPVTVDGFHIGDMRDIVLRDRQMLSEDGFVVVVIAISPRSGKLRKSPDIISRGFVYLRQSQELLSESRDVIRDVVKKSARGKKSVNFDYLKRQVTDHMRKFLLQKTGKRPLVIPVVLGI
ncbi:MAG: ribonuclease J [Candidatus Paceibacterota bacterium]